MGCTPGPTAPGISQAGEPAESSRLWTQILSSEDCDPGLDLCTQDNGFRRHAAGEAGI